MWQNMNYKLLGLENHTWVTHHSCLAFRFLGVFLKLALLADMMMQQNPTEDQRVPLGSEPVPSLAVLFSAFCLSGLVDIDRCCFGFICPSWLWKPVVSQILFSLISHSENMFADSWHQRVLLASLQRRVSVWAAPRGHHSSADCMWRSRWLTNPISTSAKWGCD